MNSIDTDCITEAHLVLDQDTCSGFPSKRPYLSQGTRGGYSTVENVHDGQRKLLMSEIQFLSRVNTSKWAKSVDTEGTVSLTSFLCVYAGACHGMHLVDLVDMFPNVYFLLIDPGFADPQNTGLQRLWDSTRVTVCPIWFDNDTMHAITDWIGNIMPNGTKPDHCVLKHLDLLDLNQDEVTIDNLLFISDIRSDANDETRIAEEMRQQKEWFRGLNAFAGLLKFRLPYATPEWIKGCKNGLYNYLAGTLYLPLYGPRSTTECRLYVERGCLDKDYHPLQHEQVMAGFNSHNRKQRYNYKVYDKRRDEWTLVKFASFDLAAEAIVMHNYRECMRYYVLSVNPAYTGNHLIRKDARLSI